jgi:hypothetical protein
MMSSIAQLAALALACLPAAGYAVSIPHQHDHREARVSSNGRVLPQSAVRRVQPASPQHVDTEEMDEFLTNSENPAGCLLPKDKATARNADKYLVEKYQGVYPVDEFREMLATRKARLWFNGTKDLALSERMAVPFCAEPETSMLEERNDEASSSIKEALNGLDPDKPIILVFAEFRIKHDYRMLQIMSLICGFQRLGIEKQVLLFTMTNESAVFLRSAHPWLRVLHHEGLTSIIKTAGHRANVPGNRVAKLVVSKLLVDMNREVILTDLDVHWLQDPTEHLRSLRTPSGELVDLAAMKDNCWLELNSGFLYYRPTDRTRALLHMALTTKKFIGAHPDHPNHKFAKVSIMSDNDQYMLNCALARAAVDGLQYVILPHKMFNFGGINEKCRAKAVQETAPMIWHTSGFSGSYELEFDRFAAMGMVDFDAASSTCIAGKRGTPEDIQEASSKVARLCVDSDPNAILVKKMLRELLSSLDGFTCKNHVIGTRLCDTDCRKGAPVVERGPSA